VSTQGKWADHELDRIRDLWPDGPDALDESEEAVLRWLATRANEDGVLTTTDRALGAFVGYGPRDVRRVLEWLAWRRSVTVRPVNSRDGRRVLRIVLRGWVQNDEKGE
jgi:hypothetical protein